MRFLPNFDNGGSALTFSYEWVELVFMKLEFGEFFTSEDAFAKTHLSPQESTDRYMVLTKLVEYQVQQLRCFMDHDEALSEAKEHYVDCSYVSWLIGSDSIDESKVEEARRKAGRRFEKNLSEMEKFIFYKCMSGRNEENKFEEMKSEIIALKDKLLKRDEEKENLQEEICKLKKEKPSQGTLALTEKQLPGSKRPWEDSEGSSGFLPKTRPKRPNMEPEVAEIPLQPSPPPQDLLSFIYDKFNEKIEEEVAKRLEEDTTDENQRFIREKMEEKILDDLSESDKEMLGIEYRKRIKSYPNELQKWYHQLSDEDKVKYDRAKWNKISNSNTRWRPKWMKNQPAIPIKKYHCFLRNYVAKQIFKNIRGSPDEIKREVEIIKNNPETDQAIRKLHSQANGEYPGKLREFLGRLNQYQLELWKEIHLAMEGQLVLSKSDFEFATSLQQELNKNRTDQLKIFSNEETLNNLKKMFLESASNYNTMPPNVLEEEWERENSDGVNVRFLNKIIDKIVKKGISQRKRMVPFETHEATMENKAKFREESNQRGIDEEFIVEDNMDED